MALFSQRFWLKLSALDARVVATHRMQQGASSRLLVGSKLVTGSTLIEYWTELKSATRDAHDAVAELNHFCAGRSKIRGAITDIMDSGLEPEVLAPAPLLAR